MKNFKEKIKIILIILPTLFLSSCLGAITEVACDLGWIDNPDHCHQAAAIQSADEHGCDKIKGSDFTSMGSNPPKDKCHLLIAENTGDIGACDNIKGGYASYTKEECILNTSKNHNDPSGCMKLTGADKADCIATVGPKLDIGEALDMDKQIEFLNNELKKGADPELQKQLDGLKKRKQDFINVLPEKEKEKYKDLSDPLNKEIRMDSYSGKIDKKTKESLLALNKAALEKGETIPRKQYEAIRDMLAWKNDPKNDIEKMDDDKIVKLSLLEKAGAIKEKLKFWKANPTPEEKKEDLSLRFYQKMLERQAAIDKLYTEKQQKFHKYLDKAKNETKDYFLGKVNDKLKKEAFGDLLDGDSTANYATAVVGEALDVVKEEAKSSEFRGLVNAYDKGMQAELSSVGGNIEKAHEIVKKRLEEDPYYYAEKRVFSKYGNLMENKECGPKNSNPLCLNKDIFFKAMKKSYKYQNKK